MKESDWIELTPRQRHVMMVAMYLRNALEDFHVANLTDTQMKELNQLIRQAIFNIVSIIEDAEENPEVQRLQAFLVASIPEYWEVPTTDTSGFTRRDKGTERRDNRKVCMTGAPAISGLTDCLRSDLHPEIAPVVHGLRAVGINIFALRWLR